MSDEKNEIAQVIKATEGLVALIRAAGDSPSGQAASRNVGNIVVTLTGTINNVLLPLAAMNFAFDKAREYFSHRFALDMNEKVGHLPPEQLQIPDPSFASQALQGLAMSHDDDALRNMYLNLLAASVDMSKINSAHPAFVDVLRQITPFEAQFVKGLFMVPFTPVARVVLLNPDFKQAERPKLFAPIRQHLLNIVDSETDQCVDDERVELMVDNFCRLGLITVSYGDMLTDKSHYDWAVTHPTFEPMFKKGQKGEVVSQDGKQKFGVGLEYGLLRLTVFGNKFAVAIGSIDHQTIGLEAESHQGSKGSE